MPASSEEPDSSNLSSNQRITTPELCVLSDADAVAGQDSEDSLDDFESLDACLNESFGATPAGDLTTTSEVKAQFTMPELQEKQLVEWSLHVTKNMGAYDMIIGRDILEFLGIDILFSEKVVTWNGSELPFKPPDATAETDYHVLESMAISSSTDRIKEILDAKYEAADLAEICRLQQHLSSDEQAELKALLEKCDWLFDGTLGTWNLEPVKLELLPDATPHHARPYPVPRCHQEMLRMEVDVR